MIGSNDEPVDVPGVRPDPPQEDDRPMTDAPAATGPETDPFDAFDQTLGVAGPEAAMEQLIPHLDQRGQFRVLLDALLLKARHELGLPLIQVGSLADLPESDRARFEEHYVEAIRSASGSSMPATSPAPGPTSARSMSPSRSLASSMPTRRPTATSGSAKSSATVLLQSGGGSRQRRQD
jgi:hypothetical protein